MDLKGEMFLGIIMFFAFIANGNSETVKGSVQLNSGVFEKVKYVCIIYNNKEKSC